MKDILSDGEILDLIYDRATVGLKASIGQLTHWQGDEYGKGVFTGRIHTYKMLLELLKYNEEDDYV